MARNKSPDEVRALERRTKVASLMLQGVVGQTEIARRLGMDASQRASIHRDVKWIFEKWKREAIRDFDAERGKQKAYLTHIAAEALAAWERSKVEKQTTRTKRRTGGEGGTTDEAEVKKELRDGNPAYLAEARAAFAQIAKLLGLDAAQKVTLGGDASAPPIRIQTEMQLALSRLSTDELQRLRDLRNRVLGGPSSN